MAKALDVARFLVRLAVTSGDEPDPVTHLRLQKLLYYTQGWHLAAYDAPMFLGRIEAWEFGPVVVEVYPHYKKHEYSLILPENANRPSGLNRSEEDFIRAIWDKYKPHSATQLSKMTHLESPWLTARGDLPASAPSNEEITPELMQAFFKPKLEATMPKGITLDRLIAAEEAIDNGRLATLKQLKSRHNGA